MHMHIYIDINSQMTQNTISFPHSYEKNVSYGNRSVGVGTSKN